MGVLDLGFRIYGLGFGFRVVSCNHHLKGLGL